MTASTEAVRELFLRTFGGEPQSFWRAPGRVNLIGEHTDYNDGYVLPFALNRATTIAVRPRDDRTIRVVSTLVTSPVMSDLDRVRALDFRSWSAYPLGVAWALGEHDGQQAQRCGFDLAIDSDVPIGAGLSSSAAIEMAVAFALNDQWDLGFDDMQLVRIAQRAENIAVGAPTGIMDQCASTFGQRDKAVFLDCRTLAVEQVTLGFDAADLVLLVVDVKVEHQHATGGYRDRRESCERGAETLRVPTLRDLSIEDLPRARKLLDDLTFRRVKHVVTENARVLASVSALRSGDLATFGSLMDESHISMRDDFEISVPQLDAVVETAQAVGAVGARMTGGGFGGCALALIDAKNADNLVMTIRQVFQERRWRSPLTFTVRPSNGAGRVGC